MERSGMVRCERAGGFSGDMRKAADRQLDGVLPRLNVCLSYRWREPAHRAGGWYGWVVR